MLSEENIFILGFHQESLELFWKKKKEEKPQNRLPPHQRPIKSILRWGIDHPGIVNKLPNIGKNVWSLTVDGEIENHVIFNWEDFLKLPQSVSVSDFHCVESWSVLGCRWEGVRFRDLVNMVKPKTEGRYVWFECADGYTTSLTMGDLMADDIILANKFNGEDLSQPLGGPTRLVVPEKYAYKSPMWVTRITFMAKKKLGYWESGIYSDTADVLKNDRYRLK